MLWYLEKTNLPKLKSINILNDNFPKPAVLGFVLLLNSETKSRFSADSKNIKCFIR